MVLGRRRLLGPVTAIAGGAAWSALPIPPIFGSARAQTASGAVRDGAAPGLEADPMPPLLPEMQSFADGTDLEIRDVQQLGRDEPPQPKKEFARRIVAEAMADPANRRPYDFAVWFRDMGQGRFGPERAPYARAWPTEYNPLVVDFFRATGTKPEGDTTSWCAAFVNFCIALAAAKAAGRAYGPPGQEFSAADKAQGTGSASSGSFRCWPGNASPDGTNAPQPGDLVVWALDGSVQGCRYERGHVAFFERLQGDRIIVVGGNQGPADREGQSGVTRRDFGRSFNRSIGRVSFHSFRTAAILR